MRVVDIVFLYEHAARELDVACAITAGLRQEGLSVEIVHWPTGFPEAVLQGQPKMVVLPFCYTEESFDALLAYWRTSIFFNMTWEQLFYLGNKKAKTPRGKFATQHVIHHAWSEIYKTFLIENGIPSNRIFLNGQPAYTLYDEPYRNFFPSKAELAEHYGLDATRPWVLFPENYNWAFYSEATLDQFIASGQSPDDVQAMREFCDLSLQAVLKWCAQAAQDDVELILRPRPSTTQQEFEAYAERVLPRIPERLHIIQKESVREWILASEVVVSSHSTSLIEAAVAGKKVYILEPSPMPPSLQVDWHTLLPHLTSKREFLDACSGELPNSDERLSQWARQTMMGQGDSIHNLKDALTAIMHDEMETPPPPPREVATPTLKSIPPAWMWSVYRQTKQWLRYRSSGGIEPEFVKDVLPSHEIENRISKWAVFLIENQA
jgi:surface carbohydrate biosynthesis protein